MIAGEPVAQVVVAQQPPLELAGLLAEVRAPRCEELLPVRGLDLEHGARLVNGRRGAEQRRPVLLAREPVTQEEVMRHVVEHAPQLGPGRGKVGGRADGADLVGHAGPDEAQRPHRAAAPVKRHERRHLGVVAHDAERRLPPGSEMAPPGGGELPRQEHVPGGRREPVPVLAQGLQLARAAPCSRRPPSAPVELEKCVRAALPAVFTLHQRPGGGGDPDALVRRRRAASRTASASASAPSASR